jgi:hypothetical protein
MEAGEAFWLLIHGEKRVFDHISMLIAKIFAIRKAVNELLWIKRVNNCCYYRFLLF